MPSLTGFTAALMLITLSELGDKTFFIGMILATRHPRRWVFAGVMMALTVMSILSVLIGRVATLFPHQYVQDLTVVLFIGFGFKLLYDASQMGTALGLEEEQAEALKTVEATESQHLSVWSLRAVLVESFTLTFVAEWGDRTQLATIALAAVNHPLGVVLGAIVGHGICAAIAVACGKLVAGRISERLLTTLGGLLFILFGVVAALGVG
ncbi:MAG: TMEM165/GDT1 family protein [Nodosilinea sp. LVE1205-7]|jgi:putative Ca2+/H+ antiporter (TMEM165/GDT1 family)